MISGFTSNKPNLQKLQNVSFLFKLIKKWGKTFFKIDNMVYFYVGNLPIILDYHLRFFYKIHTFRKLPLGFHETDRHFEGHQSCIATLSPNSQFL